MSCGSALFKKRSILLAKCYEVKGPDGEMENFYRILMRSISWTALPAPKGRHKTRSTNFSRGLSPIIGTVHSRTDQPEPRQGLARLAESNRRGSRAPHPLNASPLPSISATPEQGIAFL